MSLNSLNLPPEQHRRLELDLNDLYEDYTDTMSRLQKEAGNSVSGLVWDGESQELIKAEINRYADAANKLTSDYYSHVRDLWAQYGGIDMPEYDPPTITADRAVWQMEGGFNNTDFMGLHYKDVIPDENGVVHNNAGRTIDDLWPTFADEEQALEYVQNLIQTVGRLTMQRAVANDPTKPRWARVPRGANMRVLPYARLAWLRLPERGHRRTADAIPYGLRLRHRAKLGQQQTQRIRSGQVS